MVKKIRQHTPPKLPQFSSTPFSSLKGVTISSNASPVVEKTPAITESPAQPDDSVLFLEAMSGIRRLNDTVQSEHSRTSSTIMAAESHAELKTVTLSDEVAAADLFIHEIGRLKLEVKFTEQTPDEDVLKPLSGNRLKQLKRGVIRVDHQLDLHGLSRNEALTELPRFLRSARLKGQDAALVITGKGLNSPGEPVLQQAVAAWLREAGREFVIEFAPAPREMGGHGAFVVFLRPLP
jgi:DNA-nicking Smr family endonuclease